jgi:hypothetical protein
MLRPTDLVGLTGAAVLVAAAAVAGGRVLGVRRGGLAVLAGAALVCALVPIGPLPLAGVVRGVLGDLSVTTLVLLLFHLARDVRGGDPPDPRRTLALQALLAFAGVVLYPLAVGLGAWDPYRLGYGNPWFLAILLAVALGALALDVPLATVCAALGVLAWSLGACESRNLWDYLIDPLVFAWATSALLLRGARASVRARRRSLPQELEPRSVSETRLPSGSLRTPGRDPACSARSEADRDCA